MINIGILGLDTSHSSEFAAILERSNQTAITAVWDGADVHDPNYCKQFCTKYDATQYDHPADMLNAVDGVIVSTVDWTTHCDLAEPFLRSGTPVLIDKPIAGSMTDVRSLLDAARIGDAPLFGGSAVAFHPRIHEIETRAQNRTVFCVGYDHPFYYGPHLVDTLRSIVDTAWTSITVNGAPGASVDVSFDDGSFATLQFNGADADRTFGFLVSDDHHTNTVAIESNEDELQRMYQSFLDAFLECIRTGEDSRERLIDAATLLLGTQAALQTGETITPDCSTLSEFAIDGSEFLSEYQPYY